MKENEAIKFDSLGGWKRTHQCGSLRAKDVGQEAILMGWVNSRRDLGNLIFIDLRDREGLTQIVFDPQVDEESHRRAHVLRNEWVLAVKGKVSPRLEGQENPNLPTGAIELKVTHLKILNRTETPPFQVDGMVDASETLRLKYRYLELRRQGVFHNFYKRHLIASCIREYLGRNGFIEVETPFLAKSTPEGARDYLVPSRANKGLFYALPQSPQLFKQLLMVAGFDRYYQLVRCFRDEDLRVDRQPEFTQVDLEMAFTDEEGVMEIIEGRGYRYGSKTRPRLCLPGNWYKQTYSRNTVLALGQYYHPNLNTWILICSKPVLSFILIFRRSSLGLLLQEYVPPSPFPGLSWQVGLTLEELHPGHRACESNMAANRWTGPAVSSALPVVTPFLGSAG